MKNNLEDFINNNREEFDAEEMKINWEKVKSGMAYKQTPLRKFQRYWWAAAAGMVLIVSAVIYFNPKEKTTLPAAVTDKVENIQIPSEDITGPVDPDYFEQMKQFAILIDFKQNELKQNQKSEPDLYKQFLKDNNHLDSSYNYLKSQLTANPNKEVLLDAMIENLRLKLEILNKQLQIIKQSKNKKTDNENKTI